MWNRTGCCVDQLPELCVFTLKDIDFPEGGGVLFLFFHNSIKCEWGGLIPLQDNTVWDSE